MQITEHSLGLPQIETQKNKEKITHFETNSQVRLGLQNFNS